MKKSLRLYALNRFMKENIFSFWIKRLDCLIKTNVQRLAFLITMEAWLYKTAENSSDYI